MAILAAKLLMFLFLSQGQHCLAAGLDNCVFLGEEGGNSLYEGGDVVIGGLFPLHYSPVSSLPKYKTKPTPITYKYFSSRALRWMLTMTFAIKEINHRSDLLPHLKLGFHIRDSCDDIPVSLSAALLLVNGQPDVGTRAESVNRDKGLERNSHQNLSCAVAQTVSPVIIGDAASGVSMALLKTLGSFHIPLVSYFASCSCLSNQKEFPTFMRTMPSDAFQIRALARLVSYFGWTWVGVIGVESDYARFAIQLFLKESVKYGVCASYTHFYPVGLSQQALDELLDVIQMSSSKVIINFSSESEMQGILREVRYRNITSLQWIASEAWATAKSLWKKFGDLLTGTLGFAIRRADVIPGLKQHLTSVRPSNINESAFLAEFWEELFNCRLNGSVNNHSHGGVDHLNRLLCKGTEDLKDVYSPYSDVTQLRVSYNVYKSVYLVAHALEDMSNCKVGQGPFLNRTCADLKNVKPWQLIHYMKRANFSALGEKVNFDENGDPIAYYDLMNWQRRPDGSLHLVKAGFYDASTPDGRSLVINESVIQWPVGKQAFQSVCSVSCPPGSRIARRKGEPICCFDCVPCAEGEVPSVWDQFCPLHLMPPGQDSSGPNGFQVYTATTVNFPGELTYAGIKVIQTAQNISMLKDIQSANVTPKAVWRSMHVQTVGLPMKVRGQRKHKKRENNRKQLSSELLAFITGVSLKRIKTVMEASDREAPSRDTTVKAIPIGSWYGSTKRLVDFMGGGSTCCYPGLAANPLVASQAFQSVCSVSCPPGACIARRKGEPICCFDCVPCAEGEVIICLIWLLTSPPHANNNNTDHSAVIIIECVTGSEIGFWCVLGYISILACMCLLMAFFARKLPDNFNEAKFITFSMPNAEDKIANISTATVNFPGELTYAGIKVIQTAQNISMLKDIQSANVTPKAVWRSMHVQTVGLPMKVRGQRKHKKRENNRKQLSSELLAFITGVSLKRIKTVMEASDREAPSRDTTVKAIPIGSWYGSTKRLVDFMGGGSTCCYPGLAANPLVASQAFQSVCSVSCPPGACIARRKGEPICCFDCVPCAEGEVIICLIWLLTSPPHANNNNTDHSAVIIIECVTGSEIGFWCVLGYISILACMCLLMAFFARKLPDNFNEAKFITFSMPNAEDKIANISTATVNFPGELTYAGIKVIQTAQNISMLKDIQSANVTPKAVWRSMHVQTVGLPMKVRGQRKHKKRENNRKQLSSELLAFITGVSLKRIKTVMEASDREAPSRDTTVKAIPIGSWYGSTKRLVDFMGGGSTCCYPGLAANPLVASQAFQSVCSVSCPPGACIARRKGEPICCFDCVPCAEGEVIICLIWLLTSPPHANNNNTDHSAVIIIECVTGSEIGFWCVLGYISILACMCLLMAFFARKLPDNFNEAKFITFSMPNAEDKIANISTATVNFPGELTYAGIKVIQTAQNISMLKDIQSANVTPKAVWRSMHVQTVGLPMKVRGQRKHKKRENNRKQLSSELLAFITGVSLKRIKTVMEASDREAPSRDTTVKAIPIGSWYLPVNQVIRSRRITILIKKHIIPKLIDNIHPLKVIRDLRKGTE
ncbi:hypothetical protein NQZ68_012411 [Dissostichus eleginoides]|nr:hypothetical protein NQZ68_012411 [Dissostichus eleginoides]